VCISLFTWRRAPVEHQLPARQGLGWWGDSFAQDSIGSHLWLLAREKLTAKTLLRVEDYVRAALHWLLDDGIVHDIQVQVQRDGLERCKINLTLTQADKRTMALRLPDLWVVLDRATP
jgi:phage gp46-like protein